MPKAPIRADSNQYSSRVGVRMPHELLRALQDLAKKRRQPYQHVMKCLLAEALQLDLSVLRTRHDVQGEGER